MLSVPRGAALYVWYLSQKRLTHCNFRKYLVILVTRRSHPAPPQHFTALPFDLFRNDGVRWPTARHAASAAAAAAAGGLGGFSLRPSTGSLRPGAAGCHSEQDRPWWRPHETQQSASAHASVPHDGQWWELKQKNKSQRKKKKKKSTLLPFREDVMRERPEREVK